ncbi:MAG: DUF2089 domain-containing protein [Candidatus Spyradocola sp.]
MAHDVLHDCPVCHKPLHITKLHCPACGTSIEGDFQAERLLALTPEQRGFVFSFLRNRGNIREMEKELGISYPTVRARLDQILAALGLEPNASKEKPTRKEVLEMLAQGEISQEQAMELLKKP